MSDTAPTSAPARWSGPRIYLLIKAMVVRLSEIALAAAGLGYVLLADNTVQSEARFLAVFDAIAVAYLAIGFFVVRRHRLRPPAPVTVLSSRPWVNGMRRRSSFFLTLIASVTGFLAASDVLVHGTGAEEDSQVRGLGVTAVICAFTILHVGYAKFYRNLDAGPTGPGLRFPREPAPTLVDYLYFSITLGVSFAVSDVEVIQRSTRWHVMVHSLVSFFYNTGVLAIAVGVVTGK